ncbi:MAG: NAD(P)-binding domain-containing protein [Archangiaceae bacterium]|nr:NAD(P)-binding domain-containing protein [Archangiaceae bacterium]
MGLDVIGVTALLVSGAIAMVWVLRVRARREQADAAALAEAISENRHLPATLHPVIDADKCIGSLSCLQVCPEGDILGVVNGKAALIDAAACIGHGKCALECPVNAITLVFGTSERGVDLPETDEFFETSRKGVHIIGELGGMGLIKNAVTQGLQLASRFDGQARAKAGADQVDVAVVGAGAAGLALALGLKKGGHTFRVLEQDTVGGTIAHYPRQKVVMTEQVEMPFIGKFGRKLISKEELLETWEHAIDKSGVKVETGTKVTAVRGEDGAFELDTSRGVVRARKVVLAIGRRGTPRKLGVPGDDLPKVAYSLIDPEQYEGSRVLVVGGGDSALEAAIQLVEETDAEVALSYRQPDFGKCREANKRRFKELVAEGRMHAFLPSAIKRVTPGAVTLEHQGRPIELPNDFVLACLGGELPAKFLEANQISLKRYTGQQKGQARAKRGGALEDKPRLLPLVLFAIALTVVAGLAVVGWDYYRIPVPMRRYSAAHALLRPAGLWGHGIGIVATVVMMSNFLYAVRKRVRAFKGAGPIRGWLTFHQFVGFLAPAVVAFHAAFQSNNTVATITSVALAIVVLTGAIGRFIFGLIPSGEGRAIELGELSARFERLKLRVQKMTRDTTDVLKINTLLDRATQKPEGVLLGQLARLPLQRLFDAAELRRTRPMFSKKGHYLDFVDAFHRLRLLHVQVGFFHALKRLMSVWRVLHVVLAVVLVGLISAHIALSLYLGYKWVFS